MGNVANISAETFPKQGKFLGKRATVIFHFDTGNPVMGKVIRDDSEAPWRTIILLDDGRVVLHTECQFSPEV